MGAMFTEWFAATAEDLAPEWFADEVVEQADAALRQGACKYCALATALATQDFIGRSRQEWVRCAYSCDLMSLWWGGREVTVHVIQHRGERIDADPRWSRFIDGVLRYWQHLAHLADLEEKPWLTASEAGEYLGLSRHRVYQLLDAGAIEASPRSDGRWRRCDTASVIAYYEARRSA